MLANTTDELLPDARNVNRSCDQCRRRKIKCDFLKPQCSTCDRRNKICTYDDPVRKRGPKPKGLNELNSKDIESQQGEIDDSPDSCNFSTSLPSKAMPIPIKISYAEDVEPTCNLYPACSPNSFSASDLCPSYFNSLFISPGSSPNTSINIAFSDLSLNSPSFSPSDLESNLENIEYLNLNQPSPKDLDFNTDLNLSMDAFSGTFDTHLPDSNNMFSNEVESISRLTELETFLLSVYYHSVHPLFPMVDYDTILPLLPFVDQDMSIRFLINCMCATAAASSPEAHIGEHLHTFYSLALDSAPYVANRQGLHFTWGSALLKTYFNVIL